LRAALHPDTHERKWPGIDSDGDMLPDDYEATLYIFNGIPINLEPNNADTYNLAYEADPHWYWECYRLMGDQDLLSRLYALYEAGIANEDWSHGLYSKNWPTNP